VLAGQRDRPVHDKAVVPHAEPHPPIPLLERAQPAHLLRVGVHIDADRREAGEKRREAVQAVRKDTVALVLGKEPPHEVRALRRQARPVQ